MPKPRTGAKRSANSISAKTVKTARPRYRWVGKGEPQPDGTVIYNALEVIIAGKASLIRVGDSALLSSSNGEELDDAIEHIPYAAKSGGDASVDDGKEEELDEEELFYGSHTNDDFRSISAFDPFVAVIEKMWEIPPITKGKGKKKSIVDNDVYDDERKVRMKIKARWYFKKEDVAGMNGWFQGISKKALLSAMGPRDLVLSEHSDDNEVPTVLGRCRVARRLPLDKSNKDNATDENIPQGAYVCRYDVRIPKKGEQGFGYVVVQPHRGDPFDDEVLEQNIKPISLQKKEPARKTSEPVAKKPPEPAVEGPQQTRRKRTGNESDSTRKRLRTEESKSSEDAQTESISVDQISSDPAALESSEEPVVESKNPEQPVMGNPPLPEAQPEIATEHNVVDKADAKSETETANTSGNASGAPSVTSSGADHSTTSTTYSSSSEDDDEEEDTDGAAIKINDTENFLPASPRKQVGIIHVGEGHQAVVPPLSSLQDRAAYKTQSRALCVWIPGRVSDNEFKRYLSESRKILKNYVESQSGEFTFEPDTVSMPPCSIVESEQPAPRGAMLLKKNVARQCIGDELLDELHRSNYNVEAALAVVKKAPRKFLTLWTSSEREKFELGFQRYCGVLRSIAKLLPSKDPKDVVDYHYRFKIPEQFRKYEEQKMKQARRMMATADLRLLDNAASGGKSGTSVKKTRNWTKGGATEQRRVLAKEFLVHTRDCIGPDKYLLIANNLKLYHAKELNITMLKENITQILKEKPDLIERFNDFLPKKLRTKV